MFYVKEIHSACLLGLKDTQYVLFRNSPHGTIQQEMLSAFHMVNETKSKYQRSFSSLHTFG